MALKLSHVCEGIFHGDSWYRLPADDRGFRQAVVVAVRRDRLHRQWVATVEHVNEFGKVFAKSEPQPTSEHARIAAVELLSGLGATQDTL